VTSLTLFKSSTLAEVVVENLSEPILIAVPHATSTAHALLREDDSVSFGSVQTSAWNITCPVSNVATIQSVACARGQNVSYVCNATDTE
jgi:hypothetical protein